MPLPRQELATAVLNGNVYVVGGYDADAHSTGTVQVHNPTTDTWSLVQALPLAVNHNAAAVVGVINDKIYVAGGEGTPSQRELAVYDPVANTWTITLPAGWQLVATADFDGNGFPDYLLYNSDMRQTSIWYLNKQRSCRLCAWPHITSRVELGRTVSLPSLAFNRPPTTVARIVEIPSLSLSS